MLGDGDRPTRARAVLAGACCGRGGQRAIRRSCGRVSPRYAGQKDPRVLAQAREALALAERLDDDEAICRAAVRAARLWLEPDNADGATAA